MWRRYFAVSAKGSPNGLTSGGCLPLGAPSASVFGGLFGPEAGALADGGGVAFACALESCFFTAFGGLLASTFGSAPVLDWPLASALVSPALVSPALATALPGFCFS